MIVLLHGLVATADIFGAAFDELATTNTVLVPDMLGFGRSLDESRDRFEPADHLDALDTVLHELDLDDRPILVAGHSMGGAVALRWAQRRGPQIGRTLCWGPPIYPDASALQDAIAQSGPMARMFIANTSWARAAYAVNCRFRTAAGVVAAALEPNFPIPIARAASLHTWPAYRDAMELLVADTDWVALSQELTGAGTELDLAWGASDPIGDRNHAREHLGASSIDVVAGAGHHLPMTHTSRCVEMLRRG